MKKTNKLLSLLLALVLVFGLMQTFYAAPPSNNVFGSQFFVKTGDGWRAVDKDTALNSTQSKELQKLFDRHFKNDLVGVYLDQNTIQIAVRPPEDKDIKAVVYNPDSNTYRHLTLLKVDANGFYIFEVPTGISFPLNLVFSNAPLAIGSKPAAATSSVISGNSSNGSSGSRSSSKSNSQPGPKVGVSIHSFNDNFMTLYRNEIKDYFKSLETDTVKYNVTIMDARGDMARQTRQVDAFLAQKVDVLIVDLVQTSSADTIIQKASAANVPVVFINREPSEEDMEAWDKICYVGADPRQAGTYQGEIVADLPDKGDANGDGTVSYVMIMGDPESVDARYRTEFSIKALTDAGIQVEELFKQRGDWETSKGQELAANALTQFGDKVDVIFCNSDGMALGAYEAIAAAGRTVGEDIYLLGVDAIDECVEMVKNGTMTGTVLNDHIGQSHSAVDAAVRYMEGGSNATYIWIDYQKVTA